MKKLSVLIALMLCITIGGVYATWTYTSTSADIVDATKEVVVELEDATTTGAAGTFTVITNLALKIDQITEDDGSTDHKAQLVYGSADGEAIKLVVTFVPSVNASKDVKDFAVPAELYFTTTTIMEYPADAEGRFDAEGTTKPIFKFSNPSNGVFEGDPAENPGKAIAWTKQADGSFTAEYDLDELKEMIQLNGDIFLDTKAAYDAFAGMLSGNIAVHVTDGTVQNSSGSGDQG